MGPTQLKAFRRYQVPVHAGATAPAVAVIRSFGWTINTPNLPRFSRKQVFSELTGRIDPPVSIAQPLCGWNVAPLDLRAAWRKPYASTPKHSVGTSPATSGPVPSSGWSIVVPDLPQFRRKQALPELSGRIDPSARVAQPLFGWNVAPLDLRMSWRRPYTPTSAHSVGTSQAASGPVPSSGWSVVVSDLPQFRRKQALPELSGRIDPPVRVAQPPAGWSIAASDLPQFRRKQALLELTGRIDPPVRVAQPPSGWSIAVPDLPAFRRHQVPVHAGAVAGQPSSAPPPSPFRWFEASVAAHRTVTKSSEALSQIIGFGSFAPFNPNGWMAVPPDLPARRRCQVPAHAGVVHG